ncbi:hypothetical protein [Thalassobaculum litoreum]|uniref:Uncharacterized protein n=1 Tax=Thalassobaculum litoreum DSM 18839 TaxID=1123362 RepID=A0A8G2EYC3_9PROT|nr:hypothetical protein [Thalassobaculum litoreum]SDG50870.1 hypothetical protein SAMN05660686_04664 [Thalassobaculum litoreum DSM 18839]
MTAETKTDRRHAADKASSGCQPAIRLDTEKYRAETAELGLSADEEREYIETVWTILLQAMLLGIRLEFEAEGNEAESCGQEPRTRSSLPIPEADGVESEDRNFKSNFENAVRQADAETAEGSR